MEETPLAHDASAAAYDTAQTLVCQMHVVSSDSGMDGEVVHSLLTLLDKRIAVNLPVEVFHFAVHLFQRLVDRNGAYRHRTVAHDPFARLVDIVAGGEVHERVAAPFA